MQTPDIPQLMRERAALRGLADQCVRYRGELGTTDSPTALYIEKIAFNVAERWAAVDREARLAIKRAEACAVEAPAMPRLPAAQCMLPRPIATRSFGPSSQPL